VLAGFYIFPLWLIEIILATLVNQNFLIINFTYLKLQFSSQFQERAFF